MRKADQYVMDALLNMLAAKGLVTGVDIRNFANELDKAAEKADNYGPSESYGIREYAARLRNN